MNRILLSSRLLILVLLCAASLPAQTMPTLVQKFTGENLSSGTSVTATAGSNITTGANRYLVVGCEWDTTSTTVTVSDNAGGGGGHTYTTQVSAFAFTSSNHIAIAFVNISLGNGTKPTFKCTFGTSVSFSAIDVSEWNGIAASSPVDTSSTGGSASNPDNQDAYSGGTLTTATANTMIYSFCEPHDHLTPGPFFNLISLIDPTNIGSVSQYRYLYSTGQIDTWATEGGAGGSDSISCGNVAFKSADQTAATNVQAGGSGGFIPVAAGASSWSWTHHVPSGGSNREAIVDVFVNTTSAAPTGVTFGGTSMTLLSGSNICDVSNFECQYIYSLKAPSTGSNTVTVSFSGAKAGAAISSDYINVNQTTPLAGLQTDRDSGNSNNGNTCGSNCNPAALTVVSATGDYVYDGMGIDDQSVCPVSGTNMQWQGLLGGLPQVVVGGAPGASTVTTSWNIITINSYPSCPGTNAGAIARTHIAFDIQKQGAAAQVANVSETNTTSDSATKSRGVGVRLVQSTENRQPAKIGARSVTPVAE